MPEQNFSNHTKFVPAFHYFVLPVLLLNIGWSIHQWKVFGFPWVGVIPVLTAVALLLAALLGRVFALTVQDRIIRLEERLRYQRLLPADLQPRIGEFKLAQLVSLRFAGDEELPGLARKVLDEKITERKAIKQMIKNWKADYLRA